MKVKVLFMLLGIFTIGGLSASGQSKKGSNPVVAHRGAWKNTKVPQNSIESLQEAIKLKCVGSEFDVRITADGHPVAVHDPTHGGVSIDSSDYEQIRNLKLSNGEIIPTLEAYLKAGSRQRSTKMVLEIKTSQLGKEQTLLLARKCVELVHKLKLKSKVDYIAFDYDACKLVRELDPKANIAYLSGDKSPSTVAADGINGIDYHLNVFKKNENWIKEAHDHGLSVNVWTVNKEEDMKWFLDRNVEFITTDEPELLWSLLSKQK